MKREDFFKETVKPIEIKPRSISELLEAMAETSFQGRKLGEVYRVWKNMVSDNDVTILMGLTGSMSTAGMWKIVGQLIDDNFLDVLVSSGANISEDIYAGMGFPYGKGSPLVDDELLLKYKIDRYYDEWADEYKYREMEKLLSDFIGSLNKDHIYSTAELMYLLGKHLDKSGIDSLATRAYRKRVPIFSPAIMDSSYGIAAVLSEKGRIVLDQFKDFEQMTKIALKSDDTAVIYIGGGVPKDTIQLMAVIKALLLEKQTGKEIVKPHKYAIQITTDSPQWGGLSGATFEEAISWGKISKEGGNAVCYCDATIALPIVIHALYEKKPKRVKKNFDFVFEEVEKG
ncbi:MAG: deoxyhypusine synthase [Nitrososphaeria archaeon]|jgi:deoxyhypusine synthase